MPARSTGLPRDSVVIVSQLLTLDRSFLTEHAGTARDSDPVVVGTVKQGNQEIGLKQQSGLRRFYLGLAAVFDGAGM